MAQPSDNRRYLKLEDVRMSYDETEDLFSLSSADPEVKELGGLKLDVGSSSSAHKTLKALMQRHDLIGESWPDLTHEDRYKLLEDQGDNRSFLLGSSAQGKPVRWNVDQSPNLWIYGDVKDQPSLSSSSIPLLGKLVGRAQKNGWEVIEGSSGVHDFGSDKKTSVSDVRKIMDERLEALRSEGRGAPSIEELRAGSPSPLLLVVSEIPVVLQIVLHATTEVAAVYRSKALQYFNDLRALSTQGSTVNIHVLASLPSKNHELENFGNDLSPIFPEAERRAAYIARGRVSPSMFSSEVQRDYKPFKSAVKNRAHLVDRGLQTAFEPVLSVTP